MEMHKLTEMIENVVEALRSDVSSYYGVYYDSAGRIRYGLCLSASLGISVVTDERLIFNEIPYSIWSLSRDMEKELIAFNEWGTPYFKGTISLAFRIHEGVIQHRLIPLQTNDQGQLEFTLSEKYTQEGWQLGAALRQTDTSIRILPHAILTYNGKKLQQGLFLQENTPLSYNPNWYSEVGAKNEGYSVRVLTFLATAHGAHHHFVFSGADLTSNQLKLGQKWEYARPYFTHETWNQKEFVVNQLENSLPPLNVQGISELSKGQIKISDLLTNFVYRIKFLVDSSSTLSLRNRFLPWQAKLLNYLGPNYQEHNYEEIKLKHLFGRNLLDFTPEELAKISWVNVDPEGVPQSTNLIHKKSFYMTFLNKIQAALNKNPDQKELRDYSFLQGFSFSETDPMKITREDSVLIERLDMVLANLLGLGFYTLLQLGIMNVGRQGNQIDI
ncbi:MAG: hypothetical protein EU544_06180, partial [Promethearchaeota archaeon]